MRDYVILTDSGTDLSYETAEQLGISMLDMTVIKEGDTPRPNSEVDVKEFYDFIRSKKTATTAAINTDTFISAMEKLILDGKDVIYLGFSSGLSSTFNSGRIAAEELSEKYPEHKIYACDTLCASLGQGMLVYLAARKQQAGASIDEIRDFVESHKLKLCHEFTVDNLMYLKRGGRVSATTAVLGTMLSIKPVMHMDNEGKLIKLDTTRGRRASLDAIFEKMKAKITDTDTVFICHGDCLEDAKYLEERAKKELGIKEIFIGYTGVVIGSHSGPGTMALFYLSNER